MSSLFLALITALHAYAGDVLIVDLNNSAQEVAHCQAGVAENNQIKGGQDQVVVAGAGQPVDAASLERLITAKERQGVSFDSIVISGHDGSGHFFGQNGDLVASDMAAIVQRHPKLKTSLTGMALWGCYTSNANASENYWMKNISPNIKSTIGFTLQSPDNKKPGNWALLQDYCQKREQVADASNQAEMNEVFYGLKGIGNWNASVCYGNGICSNDYAQTGEKNRSCYHSYEELYQRCNKFDPGGKLKKTFQNYFSAGAGYENPPPDGEDEFTTAGAAANPAQKGELRRYYNQLHLWYHCSLKLRKDVGYVMPAPSVVIRLTKFETVKRNFEKLHAKELKEYNDRLAAMGLGDLALQPSGQSRHTIVTNTAAAVAKLEALAYSGNRKVNGVDPYKMLIMAYGFDNSLRTLEPSCVPFSYVHEDATRHNSCVTTYGMYPTWPKR